MKTRVLFILMLTMSLLLMALPVFAADTPVSMWVSRVRLNYIGRSYSSPDRVIGLAYLRDDGDRYFGRASVTALWTLPDTTTVEQTVLTPYRGGIAKFTTWAGPGEYMLCVTNVTDWTEVARVYDPALNIEDCVTYVVP